MADAGDLKSPGSNPVRVRPPPPAPTDTETISHWRLSEEVAASGCHLTLDVINATRYYGSVIRSFRDPETERIFNRERSRRLPQSIHRPALRKLLVLDAADSLSDLRVPPGNRLEKLSGDRKGQHSIRINDQWRICFRWEHGDAFDVEITDYH
jgi:proteic killer suppression protein